MPTGTGSDPTEAKFDVVIIGGGSAGFAAARTAAELGARTAVIEGGREIGGLCILRGCMPSKALLESAHRWHAIGEAAAFGLKVEPRGVDMPAVQARKQRLIGDFADYRRQQLLKGNFTFLRGQAAFLDPHTVEVQTSDGPRRVRAAAFILTTGSVIQKIPIPGLWETGCWTSDTALEAKHIPKRLAVLGGGIVAVELGQFFSRVGSETTLLQRSERLVRSYAPDMTAELEKAFRQEKLEVITGVKILGVSREGESKKISYLCGETRKELVVDEILYAMGRQPAVEGLGLENAGIAVEGGRLKINAAMSTTVPHIFAAGDVAGPFDVVHIAIQQGECAARNAVRQWRGAKDPPEEMDYRLKTLITFTDPEIASVGASEADLTKQGRSFLAAKYPFNDHGKSLIGGHLIGFVKVIADAHSGEILGGEIIGPHASDLIHELIAVMHFRGSVRDLATMPHYHPTLSEILTYPAEELAGKIKAR
jgi:pyruvate/2-oxoglutarate dehydrogenase complex dihydrolipoamide dehydrogenase (E3) component